MLAKLNALVLHAHAIYGRIEIDGVPLPTNVFDSTTTTEFSDSLCPTQTIAKH